MRPFASRSSSTALVAIVVVGLGIGVRGASLLAEPEPLGRDGYYYVLQIESMRSSGLPTFHTPFPVALYLIELFTRGYESPEAGIKVFSLALTLWLASSAAALAFASGTSWWWPTWAATVIASSNSVDWLTTEFLKQGVALLLFAIFMILRTTPVQGAGASRKMATGGVALACILSHASGAVLVGIFLLIDLAIRTPRAPAHLAALAAGAGYMVSDRIASRWSNSLAEISWAPIFEFGGGRPAELGVLVVVLALGAFLRSDRSGLIRNVEIVVLILFLNPWLRYRTGLAGQAERLLLCVPLLLIAVVPTVLGPLFSKAQSLNSRIAVVLALLVGSLPFASGADPPGVTTEEFRRKATISRSLACRPALGVTEVLAANGDHYQLRAVAGLRAFSPSHKTVADAWLLVNLGRSDLKLPSIGCEAAPWRFVRRTIARRFMREAGPDELAELLTHNWWLTWFERT